MAVDIMFDSDCPPLGTPLELGRLPTSNTLLCEFTIVYEYIFVIANVQSVMKLVSSAAT
jgi:hypothetical protein